jgi:hypothetical protein
LTPEPPVTDTYENSSGAHRRKRRKQTRKRNKTPPLLAPQPTHPHRTRANKKKQQHTAAAAAATTFHSDANHCALHSTAINPDTGHTAKYHARRWKQRYEYVRIPIEVIPPVSIIEHDLLLLVHNGFVYAKCRKGMYGLPQAGCIANDCLTAFLAPKGYAPVPVTPGLWRHDKSDLAFTLVVDDFGIRYTNPQDVKDLMNTLNELYKVSEDWTGGQYCGLTLEWDYVNGSYLLCVCIQAQWLPQLF